MLEQIGLESFASFGETPMWNLETYLPYALKLLEALLLIGVGIRLLRWFAGATERVLLRRDIDQLLAEFIRTALTSLGIVVLCLAALQAVGIPTGSFLAVLGTAGLAVGLALKDSLSHLAAGVMLILLRPFRAGDVVRAAGQEGSVQHVGLFQTVLRSADNRQVSLPNSTITAQPIINYSSCATRRSEAVLLLSLDAPLDAAVRHVAAALDADARVQKDPAPSIVIAGLGERGASLQIQYWTRSADMDAVRSGLLTLLARELPAQGCSLVGPGAAAPLPALPAPA